MIVHKSLVGEGYYRFSGIVRLENTIYENRIGFYLPEDILEYIDHDGIDDNEYWIEFSNLIKRLKTPSGSPLGESKELTRFEKFDIEYYKAEYKKKKILEDVGKSSLGARLLENYKYAFHLGYGKAEYIFRDMEENSIKLSEFDKKRIENLYAKIVDTSHLWCCRGLSYNQVFKEKYMDIMKSFLGETGIDIERLDD